MEVFTPEQYIASLEHIKRADFLTVHRFLKKAMPDTEPFIVQGMMGYGSYPFKSDDGYESRSASVALKSTSEGFSMYIPVVDSRGYLVEQVAKKLGKVNTGKSCIRFQRLEDIELDVLAELLAKVRQARRETLARMKPRAKAKKKTKN